MSNLADLYPGFESHWVATDAGRIFARSGGAGPPLVLLHGYPQTHVLWHRMAPALVRRFTLVIPDLRGYGWSSAPRPDAAHQVYSKRVMAEDIIRVMSHLGHARFRLVGHDRGARVGYRLALDHPGRVERLAVLDIIPTLMMWEAIEARTMTSADHWLTLARPSPEPEEEIGRNPWAWQREKLAGWSGDKTLKKFDPRAIQHYRAFFADPSRIAATCADYRAGATTDRQADEADRAAGRTIDCPVLAVWGAGGIPASGVDPLAAWRVFAPAVTGVAVDSGHFIPEENPAAALAALETFL